MVVISTCDNDTQVGLGHGCIPPSVPDTIQDMDNSVACVITSFNNMPFLKEAVGSVLDQTRRPDEIIIADDGSVDGSRQYLEGLARDVEGLRLIFRDKNLGVAANRDLAVRQASSRFITTLDGDDVFLPDKIESELALLGDQLDCLAYSDIREISSDGGTVTHHEINALSTLDIPDRVRYLLYRQGPIPRDMLYSRALFDEAGGYRHDIAIYEDWDLKLRLAEKASKWLHTGQCGIKYRRHNEGLASADPLTLLSWQLDVITRNRGWLAETLGPEEVYKSLLLRIANSIGYRGVELKR